MDSSKGAGLPPARLFWMGQVLGSWPPKALPGPGMSLQEAQADLLLMIHRDQNYMFDAFIMVSSHEIDAPL